MSVSPSSRIPSLDGLRAFSILLVIIGHMWGRFAGLSIFGVHIFFVISGYLITTLLQNEYCRDEQISLVDFYRRRCFRILPAAYTYIFIGALLWPVSRSALLYAATYMVSYHLYNIPLWMFQLWSLSVEEQFYLLWPIALVLGFRYRGRIACLAMAIAALWRLVFALSPIHVYGLYMHFSFPGSIDSIAAGCLLAIYEPQIRGRFGWMSEATPIVVALPVTAHTLGGLWWGESPILGVRCMSAFWGLVPLLIALWIFLLVERQDQLFNNRIASTLGVLSYSLYLWQQPFTEERRHGVLSSLLLISSCAALSYVCVEKPMLRLGAILKPSRIPAPRETAAGELQAAD